jgi:hypothetical protein
MSAVTVKIEMPPESRAVIKKLQAMPNEIPRAVKRGMDFALSVVRGRIQKTRLSGRGPYPPAEHRLGIVTQQFQRSLREEPAVIRGTTVTGAIGSPIFYGAIHEFGKGKAPERAPVRTGIAENAKFIIGEISSQLKSLIEKKT